MLLEAVVCPECDGLVTWVSDELKPLKPGSPYVMYQATVRCAACDQTWVMPYRTNQRPAANLPPVGAHFFDRCDVDPQVPYYDPARAVVARAKPTGERCTAFGYKCAWYAVPGDVDATALLAEPTRASWTDGVAEAYRGAIFLTPRVGAWSFLVSTSFFDDEATLLPRLGKGAQYFASDRVIGLNVAVRAGKRMTVGDEEKLMKQAGKWGMNPQDLGTTPSDGALGWLADRIVIASTRK